MDPMTTLGLVANIVQVISFASDLVSSGNSIYNSTNGALEKNTTAEELANDMRDLTSSLSRAQSTWVQAHGGTPLDADEVRLRNICERCNETAVELSVWLHKLKVQEGARFRRLKSYRVAIISVWKAEEVEKVASRLDKYQRELDTRILVGLRKNAQDAEIRSNAHFTTLDQRTQDMVLTLLNIDKKLDTRLDDHEQLLGRIYENTNQLMLSRRTPSPSPAYEEVAGKQSNSTPLHEAAAAGDLLKVRQGLRSWSAGVNARDDNGCTPLHVARTRDVVKRLVATDTVRLNAEDDQGRTALHYSVLTQRLEVIKGLLEAGIDQLIEDDYGRTAAFYAQDCNAARWMIKYGSETEAVAWDHLNNTGLFEMAWLGDLEGTRFFIDQGADVNARNSWTETALTESSRHGSVEVVELLLAHGAKVEVTIADHGWTPLTQAVRDDRPEVVRILLDHGANMHAKLKSGCDAVAEACVRGHHVIARMLIERGARLESLNHFLCTPLLEASKRNDGDWMRWLLRRGAKADGQDSAGRSPVWHAANGAHHRTLAVLLEHRSPIELPDNDHWRPLGRAANRGHYDCVRLLLNAGADADVHQSHGSGYTAFCEACHHGHADVVKLLIEHGANMEIGSKSGFSALSVAAVNGQDDVVRVLAKAGADLNKPGFANKDPDLLHTPLMRAIHSRKSSTALLLIELGADVNLASGEGKTALFYAADTGNPVLCAALLKKGANVDAQSTTKWETALMLAAAKGNFEVTSVLLEYKANTRLRDSTGRTAWTSAVHMNHDHKLQSLLGPGHLQDEALKKMQDEAKVDEIAKYMEALYR